MLTASRSGLLILSLLSSCDDDNGATGAPDAGDAAAPDAAPVRASEVLGTGSIMVGDSEVTYELVRLPRADGGSTYVQWVHALEPGRRAVVVMTQPYEGIDWSGEPVDAQFAAAAPRPNGRYPDLACPEPDALDEGVVYYLAAPDAMAQSAVGYLLNGHAVMLVYGRYYACDDLDGDIADMTAALDYVATRPDADPAHVGVIGNSWGGFLALYGAAHAPVTIGLDAVVPLNPPSDFAAWLAHVDSLETTWPRPAELSLFHSYRRRVLRATGGPPGSGDFARFSHAAVCDGLGTTPTLLLHDEWDTLVPISQSTALVGACAKDGLWWPRQGALDPDVVGLDHGLLGDEPGYPSVFTFSQVYLLARLNDAQHPRIALASRAAVASFLGLLHAEQVAGGDVTLALPRLREAAAPGVLFLLVEDGMGVEAATVLAEGVNLHWGTSFDAAGLRAQLEVGLPSP